MNVKNKMNLSHLTHSELPLFVRLIQLLYADMKISGEVKTTEKDG